MASIIHNLDTRWRLVVNFAFRHLYIYDMIYLLTAIGLTPGGSSTADITHKQYVE
jgi:hypothetical protein